MQRIAMLGAAVALAVCGFALEGHAQAANTVCSPETVNAPLPLVYQSPTVLDDGRVQFRICLPGAAAVKLVSSEMPGVPPGTFGKDPGGQVMTKDADGFWSTTLGPVEPGTYRYSFDVAGARVPDPKAQVFTQGFSGVSSILDVPGPQVAVQMFDPNVRHGQVSVIQYASKSLGITRRAHVYTPPGYERGGSLRYPVLYLVHGAGDTDDAWTTIGHANDILDNLIAVGKVKPMIVVMPYGHTPPRAGVNWWANTDFGNDLLKDLIPYIDGNYRTLATARDRAMAGLSMGGNHTIQFGITHPEIFQDIGVFSMGLSDDERVKAYVTEYSANLKRRAASPGLLFYAIGKDDFLYPSVAPTRKVLDQFKIKYTYRESTGGHVWKNWREYLVEFLPQLFSGAQQPNDGENNHGDKE